MSDSKSVVKQLQSAADNKTTDTFFCLFSTSPGCVWSLSHFSLHLKHVVCADSGSWQVCAQDKWIEEGASLCFSPKNNHWLPEFELSVNTFSKFTLFTVSPG